MRFALDEHQLEVQQQARAFAESTLAPVAAEYDRQGTIPPSIIAGAADLGLLGCERDFVGYVAGLIEISKEWASLAAVISVHNSLVCYPISRFGDAAQKLRRDRRECEIGRLDCLGRMGCRCYAGFNGVVCEEQGDIPSPVPVP